MNVMLFQITGHSTVSLKAYSDPQQPNVDVRITGPSWGEFLAQRGSNAEKASIWWHSG